MSYPKDPYQTLGLSHSASEKEIRNAYRKLVLKYHPDRNNNSKASRDKFNEIQKAYELLSKSPDLKSVFKKSDSSNKETYYKSVKDIFKLRIILPKAEVVKGSFQIKVFSLHRIEYIKLKLDSTVELLEKKEPENIILTTGNIPTQAWNTIFILFAKKSGQIEIGPASYIHEGIKYESERAFVNVYEEAAYKKKLKSEKKLNRTVLSISLMLVFLISTAMLYNIILDQTDPERQDKIKTEEGRFYSDTRLPTGSAPYAYFYGNNIKEQNSEHSVQFIANPTLDQVVFLVEYNSNRVIRHNYILSGDTFEMTNIPDGRYYVKVFFGRDWKENTVMTKDHLQGGFSIYRKFISFSEETQLLNMERVAVGDSLAFNAYRITLFKVEGGEASANEIKEEQFF